MLEFLPKEIYFLIKKFNIDFINEIRLRLDSPIIVNLRGENKFLSNEGVCEKADLAYVCRFSHIQEILLNISNNCLYSINDQLINGYVTLSNGVRIGVSGEVVYVNNQIKTIKNISSLNIRIPHFVKNCSLNAYLSLVRNNKVCNTLVVSPAGGGKTTFLRDLTYQLISRLNDINILIADERGEISAGLKFFNESNLCGYDVYSGCTKKFAFENGIRSMSPDVIITDELNFSSDSEIIENALTCGVKVVASIHANNIYDLKQKPNFISILQKRMFQKYVVLSSANGPGTFEGVFDENLQRIVL